MCAMTRGFVIFLLLFFVWSSMAAPLTATEVKLETAQGRVLNANLASAPDWPTGPVVLMVHGTLAHKEMELMHTLQSLFLEQGVSSLAVNLSLGLDDRHGFYDCGRTHRHRHADAVLEIGDWMDWLRHQGVDSVFLLGHSRGGNQAAWYAVERKDPSLRGLILLAPMTWRADRAVAEYADRYGKPLPALLDKARELVASGRGHAVIANVDFLYCRGASATAQAILSYYGEDARKDTPTLLRRVTVPVLVFAGSEDRIVSDLVDRLRALPRHAPVEMVVVSGADHFFRDLHADEVVERALEFMGR